MSKSGIGYSFGIRGFRLGKDARDRKYRAVSIPGTGIYRRDYGQTSNLVPPRPVQGAAPAFTPPVAVNIKRNNGSAAWLVWAGIGVVSYLVIRAVF